MPVAKVDKGGALPKARPAGLAGKPPFSKDRYPASFVGRPKGSKSKAPNRRQMESALASAIAMRSGDPKLEADATAPDFLERFGVKRALVTRLANGLSRGELTMTQAMSDFGASAEKAGHPIQGFSSTVVKPQQQAVTEDITQDIAPAQAGAAGVNLAPVGETPSSGGQPAGGEIPSTVPTAAVVAPVSTVEQPAPSLPSAAGAGANSTGGVGEYPPLFTTGQTTSFEEPTIVPRPAAKAAGKKKAKSSKG